MMRFRFSTPGRNLPLAAAILFCCSFAVAWFWLIESRAVAATRPNVVLIQVDDMSKNLLRSEYRDPKRGRWVPAMPNLLKQVAGRGVEFSNYYVSDPICGPSRASLLTGRATHNHGMKINVPPFGYPFWQNSQISQENLPVWLERAGYRTIHVGKYFNGYGADPQDEVPAGWDRFISPTNRTSSYYGNPLNINGQVTPPIGDWQVRDDPGCVVATIDTPGFCTHSTDLQTAYAVDEIAKSSTDLNPFYLQLDYNAPHDDGRRADGPEPPARLRPISHRTDPPGSLGNRPVSPAQPQFIRGQAPLAPDMQAEIRERWGNEVASVKGVDEGIGRILDQLEVYGMMENTYVIFTSDNGMFHGEHRIQYGKFLPHEPSTRQPLIMRGPGLPANRSTTALSSNLNLASTVLTMTGVGDGAALDGGSLIGFARHPRQPNRVPVLLEGFNGLDPALPEPFLDGGGQKRPNQAVVLNYTGLVSDNWKYVAYSYGEEELYNLAADPGEMRNLAAVPRYARITAWGRKQAARLATCLGPECRLEVQAPRLPRPGSD